MSAFQFYKTLNYPHWEIKEEVISSNTTIVVKSPLAANRLAVTNLNIAANLAGSIQIWFTGDDNRLLFEGYVGGSGFITPSISGWETSARSSSLAAKASTTQSGNGWRITAEGFELD